MKTLLTFLILSVIPIAAIGCGWTEAVTSTSPEKFITSFSCETPRIRIGMMNSLVLSAQGDRYGKDAAAQGEIWGRGGRNQKRQIPYAEPLMKVQTSKVLFGTDGLVKKFCLTDKGDVMSEKEEHTAGFNPW